MALITCKNLKLGYGGRAIIDGLNFDDHSNYDKLIEEAIDKAIAMRDVFKNRLK